MSEPTHPLTFRCARCGRLRWHFSGGGALPPGWKFFREGDTLCSVCVRHEAEDAEASDV